MRAWILGRAITRCDRIFADFIVCTACRDSGPTLLARQIIPADFVVTNYLEHEAVYSNRYTVSSHCLRTRYPPYPRNDHELKWSIEIFLFRGGGSIISVSLIFSFPFSLYRS